MPGSMFLEELSARPAAVLADPGSVERSHRRCRTEYGLTPDLMRPILRLQQKELALRSQAFSTRIGAGRRDIAALARAIARTGGLLVVSDTAHIVLSVDETAPFPEDFIRNGIAPGSCWNERIAGTNGIQMALDLGRGVTVRGTDHFYTSLQGFSCTAVPIVDEEGEILGTLNVAAINDGRIDTLTHFHRLLEATANLLQEGMFRRRYAERIILALRPLSSTAARSVPNALIALDDTGTIMGATDSAARLLHLRSASHLISTPVSTVLDLDADAILRDGPSENLLLDPDGPGIVMNVSLPATDNVSGLWMGGQVPIGSVGGARARQAAPRNTPRILGRIDEVATEISGRLARGIPVVLDGESGTGKSTIIRHLQEAAPQRNGAFLVLDCEGLDDTAAFLHRVWGFLDEPAQVGGDCCKVMVMENLDLSPPAVQSAAAAILHELEEAGRFRSLHKQGVPPVHVVSCFSREIGQLIDNGSLRRELLFLLQGERITLPPLRADPSLADTLCDIARDIAGQAVRIDAEAMDVLGSYQFPGNLREARGIVHHALSMSGEARISLAHLPRYLLSAQEAPRAPGRVGTPQATAISQALAVADWNVSLAARRLGISRATINRKMREHGITRPSRNAAVRSGDREQT